MYFVAKQHVENGHTYNVNVRIGGFRTLEGAQNAARRHGMCLIMDEHHNLVAQNVMTEGPKYVH